MTTEDNRNVYKSKKPAEGPLIKVKLTTEAEREKAEAEAKAAASTPKGDPVEEAVKALKGEVTPPSTPVNVEWVQDDTYHQTMEGLREVGRLADRGRYALTAEEVRQMQTAGSQWMTYEEVAQYLSVEVETVRNKVSAGQIPFSRRGGIVRFKRETIDAWLEESGRRRRRKS